MARKEKNKKEVKGFSSFLNNQIDFTLLITILLLLSIGLIMVLSASAPSSLQKYGNNYKFFEKIEGKKYKMENNISVHT